MAALSVDLRARRRAWTLAALSLLMLVLHAWGLNTLRGLAFALRSPEVQNISITVRSIEPPPAEAAAPAAPEAAPALEQPAPAVQRKAPPITPPPAQPVAGPIEAARPEVREPASPEPLAPAVAQAASDAFAPEPLLEQAGAAAADATAELMNDATEASDTGGTIVGMPVYPTALPASGTWRYRMQRGSLLGEAVLDWALQADGSYALSLEGAVVGARRAVSWRSQGGTGPFGVSPTRFVVRRPGRGEQAVNFNTESRSITFSSSGGQLPWVNGVQDRLSWLVQLPAIVRARPDQYETDATLLLMVVGAGGGAELWQFQVMGMDSVEGRPALKLLRLPGQPYGTKVQVWLDPARNHLPLRAILTQGESGNPLQLDLLP